MIAVRQYLSPFSHLPGTQCLIPQTEFVVEAYPTLIQIKDLMGKVVKEHVLNIQGPLKEFTLQQDLERGYVTIFSEQFRLHVLPDLTIISGRKAPIQHLRSQERLFFGCHKKQEWEKCKQRGDFREIFPFWFRLGSLLELSRSGNEEGIFALLEQCRQTIASHRPEMILPAFKKVFLAGFRGMLVPRLVDEDLQGIVPSNSTTSPSPLYLLSEGAQLIRSLFISSSQNAFSILPNLPPEFFSGRIVNIQCLPFGEMDMEWSKKTIRKIVFRARQEGEVQLIFSPSLRQFRLSEGSRRKEKKILCGEPLVIKSGCSYLLDQFQK